jgi:hypothetical protein
VRAVSTIEARPTRVELLVVGLILLGAGILAYGSFVLHGGFISDDWSDAASYQLANPPRYWSTIRYLSHLIGGRPVQVLLLPVPDALFGLHPSLHLALALALGIATSFCLYLALRTLRMARLHAGAIAVLSLLFPWSEGLRLWPTASLINISACFFLLGLAVALRGLDRPGRGGAAMHAGAAALYVLSVLTYQAVAAEAILAGFLYLGRAPRRRVVRRWLTDVVAVLGAVVYSLVVTVKTRSVGSLHQRIVDVSRFVREGASLLASALVPAGPSSRVAEGLVLLAAAAIVGAAIVQARRSEDAVLRYWLSVIGIAVVAIGAAYFMFLGSFLYPLDSGVGTRVNSFAGLAYCVLVYGLVVVAARLLVRNRSVASAGALAVIAAIAVGYGIRLGNDESTWRRASALQHELLDKVAPSVRRLAAGGTLLTFGYPADVVSNVPIFDRSWDLNGAVQLQAGDPTVSAYPVFQGVSVRCERDGLVVDGPGSYETQNVRYGGVLFVDARTGDAMRIGTRAVCTRALRRFHPGPLFAE